MSDVSSKWLDEVDVAVVSHNGRQTLPRVLACLIDAGVPADRITLYDIASTDDTGAWLGATRPDVRVVALPINDGPNPARNLAIRDATRRFLLLVDSDAYLRVDAPAALHATAAGGTTVGAVVPIVVHERDPRTIQYAGGRLHFLCEAITPWADRPVADRGREPARIGTAPGACLLLDVAAARHVGGFDPRYFLGKEDGEFCFRLNAAGYDLIEEPRAVLEHGSRPRSTWLFPFQIRNRWHFMLKNYETRTLVAIAPALAIHEPLQFALLVAKGQGAAWFRAARELWPMTRGLRRERREQARRRTVHDRAILGSAPLSMRADLVGGRAGRGAKQLYDRWLAAYWKVAAALLP